ncbi:MAG: hypothetical protein M3Q30_19535 [Actinomycetota bacterium]|nr:hypothetical protein [Actinomycetota bacterium]
MRSLILLTGTSALVAGALTGCSASGSTAAKDVTITACAMLIRLCDSDRKLHVEVLTTEQAVARASTADRVRAA